MYDKRPDAPVLGQFQLHWILYFCKSFDYLSTNYFNMMNRTFELEEQIKKLDRYSYCKKINDFYWNFAQYLYKFKDEPSGSYADFLKIRDNNDKENIDYFLNRYEPFYLKHFNDKKVLEMILNGEV